ncbi:MAG TPA: hypothetical protein VF529_09390 [Solirubrobacteraceae bacterium]|jgi:hypothetical protein
MSGSVDFRAYRELLVQALALPDELDQEQALAEQRVRAELRRHQEGHAGRERELAKADRALREHLERAARLPVPVADERRLRASAGDFDPAADPVAHAVQLVERAGEALDRLAGTAEALESARRDHAEAMRAWEQRERDRAARERAAREEAARRARNRMLALAAVGAVALVAAIALAAAGSVPAAVVVAAVAIGAGVALYRQRPKPTKE